MPMAVYEFLRNIPLFAELPADDLEQLCKMSEEVELPAGEQLFQEGSLSDRAYVIREGTIEIRKRNAGREVLLSVRKPGEVIGEMSLLDAAPRMASAYAREDTTLVVISQNQVDTLLDLSPSAARVLVKTVTERLRSTNLQLRESEKLAQLGTLTAGIAHELNNPASAAQRGASQIREALDHLMEAQWKLTAAGLADARFGDLQELQELARERASQPLEMDPLERSDREAEVEEWLEEHDFAAPWELAPQIASLGLTHEELTRLSQSYDSEKLMVVLGWLCALFQAHQLLAEIEQGAARISEIIKALKGYVYLDQAPVQDVNIHEGLNNTLVLLRSKLKDKIMVRREYAEHLPTVEAYGSELNQVWTNLIDNAIDAMLTGGGEEILLHTRQEGDFVVVSIEDNGPGIPEDVQPRIFDPFFTTKPQGKGTGLGLSISYGIIHKHGGEIKMTTQPRKTRFEVWLPIKKNAA